MNAPQAKILRFRDATKGILPCKMSAAGENFAVSGCYKGDFTLQNKHRRRTILRFQNANVTKEILPYRMSAAGENFVVSKHCKGYFTIQNERAADENFAISGRYKGDFTL